MECFVATFHNLHVVLARRAHIHIRADVQVHCGSLNRATNSTQAHGQSIFEADFLATLVWRAQFATFCHFCSGFSDQSYITHALLRPTARHVHGIGQLEQFERLVACGAVSLRARGESCCAMHTAAGHALLASSNAPKFDGSLVVLGVCLMRPWPCVALSPAASWLLRALSHAQCSPVQDRTLLRTLSRRPCASLVRDLVRICRRRCRFEPESTNAQGAVVRTEILYVALPVDAKSDDGKLLPAHRLTARPASRRAAAGVWDAGSGTRTPW